MTPAKDQVWRAKWLQHPNQVEHVTIISVRIGSRDGEVRYLRERQATCRLSLFLKRFVYVGMVGHV